MRYHEAPNPNNGHVVEVHISDIHFGKNAKEHYEILYDQFICRIRLFHFHILSINGDLFDRKEFANSEAIAYAMKFVDDCVNICRERCATMVLIHGTRSHDADQLKLFTMYESDPNVDFRIVETTRFEIIKGLTVLCIPEEYGRGAEYYDQFLSKAYDTVFFHGTIVGGVYGANASNLDSSKYPVFSINDFALCRGPIIGGHVHKAMCLNGYIYYTSDPIRKRFGEEDPKGFMILLHDTVNHYHSAQFIEINSYRYDTINVHDLNTMDPEQAIQKLNYLHDRGMDYIRLNFDGVDNSVFYNAVNSWAAANGIDYIKFHHTTPQQAKMEQMAQESAEVHKELSFLLDKNLDEYTKFVMYINQNKGSDFITVEELKKLLKEC